MKRSILLLLLLVPAMAQDAARTLEPVTESLDHLLVDLAIAARTARPRAIAAMLNDPFDARMWPDQPLASKPKARWIRTHRWRPVRDKGPTKARAWAESTLTFLRRHGSIAHFRLQPTAARLDGDLLRATVRISVVGTRGGGYRWWTRGRAEVACTTTEPRKLVSFRLLELNTDTTEQQVFRDAGILVGIGGVEDPPVMGHPTLGLAAYGAATADLDADGWLDIFSPGQDKNYLYHNVGDGTFRKLELALPGQATAPLFLDMDNDGDPDLFCSANGKQMLLENRFVPSGKLEFIDVSEKMGVAVESIGFSAVAGDVNRDGRPDIYVACYNNYGPVAPDNWDNARNGLPNLLFVSKPDGTYEEAAKRWGVDDSRWSYAAQFVDLDEDGKLDLYVANDFGAGNALFMNRGNRFEDVAEARGVRDDGYAMGVSFGDVDNDGRLDLHVTRMSSKAGTRILDLETKLAARTRLRHLGAGNGLYKQRDDGTFEDITAKAGPFPAGWAWGGGFLDIDNDGWEDLYTPNGHLSGAAMKDT